jgi:hypothetical protein
MNQIRFFKCCCVIMLFGVSACETSFDEKDQIFHGSLASHGIGKLSFSLYKDQRYLIINSGGIGSSEYIGSYALYGDTILLYNLNKEVPLESNKLVIYRYEQQDSSYWEWKYSRLYKSFTSDKTLGKWDWTQYKSGDKALGEGDVYQIDANGIPIKEPVHFIIRLDSLRNYQ